MNRFCISALAALALFGFPSGSAASPQDGSPGDHGLESVERLIELVAAGQDLRNSQFRGVVSTDGAAKLLRVAECEASTPRYSQSRASAIILWNCSGRLDRSSASAMVQLDQGRITAIDVMSAVMVPARSE